jgi:hypothetical protein
MPELEPRDERGITKITGVLADMLVKSTLNYMDLPFVVYEKNRKVLYVQVMRAIYRILEAAYYGTRSLEENWNKKDSSLILMIHVSPTMSRKDDNIRFFFMWTI